jgi:hypothetical protein
VIGKVSGKELKFKEDSRRVTTTALFGKRTKRQELYAGT